MTVRYLIDTDWVIDHLNQVERVVNRLKELWPAGLALSIISLAELYEDVYYSRDPDKSQVALETFLEDVAVLGTTKRSVSASGKSEGGCEKKASSLAISICSSGRPRSNTTSRS